MRLIQQLEVSQVADFAEVVDFGPRGPVFCECVLATSQGQGLAIYDSPAGATRQCFYGEPAGVGGPSYNFGGPVVGPTVVVQWTGAPGLKEGVFRFWEGFHPPFGRVHIGSKSELAIPALGVSNIMSFNLWGAWVAGATIYEEGSTSRVLRWRPVVPGGLAAFYALTTLGVGFNQLIERVRVESVDFEWTNTDAVNALDVSVTVYGVLDV